MSKKKLSVITITYNNLHLKRTLDSVLTQKNSHSMIEHIIVDNLSDDGTEAVVAAYIKRAPYKVIYIREKDKGRYDAMNKGIMVAEGEYLSFMNAGDHFYDANSVSKILKESKDYDIVYGNINVVNHGVESIHCPPSKVDFKFFLSGALPHQASVIKKSLFKRVGFYDEGLTIAGDIKFYLLAICKFKCSYLHINEVIATYYFDGISSLASSVKKNESEKNSFLNTEFSQQETRKFIVDNKVKTKNFETPILFIIFNRPDVAQKVFEEIRKIKPKFLFVAADGPRDGRVGEKEKCKETRDILKQVDWDCEVKTLFRDTNFGCGYGVSKAITWFFENVEEGIILEDDCVPDETFFPYCEELLKIYHNDSRISHINGTSFVCQENSEDSYYYSTYYHVWGWATWRRAWNWYDFSMRNFDKFCSSNQIGNIFSDKIIQNFWLHCFNEIYIEKRDTWDYQWVYSNFINNGLSIMPHTNLIKNVGFNDEATHTTNPNDQNANRVVGKIKEIKHPSFVIHNVNLDNVIYANHICLPIGSQVVEIPRVDIQKEPETVNHRPSRHILLKKILHKYFHKVIYGRFRQPLKKIYLRFKIDKIIKL